MITFYVGIVAAFRSSRSPLLAHIRQHLLSPHPLINLHFNRDSGFNEDRDAVLSDDDLKLFAPEQERDRLEFALVPVGDGNTERVLISRG